MIAGNIVNITKDDNLDTVYIISSTPLIVENIDLDTEEIEDGIYRVYDENKLFTTYRFTILDFSYNNK